MLVVLLDDVGAEQLAGWTAPEPGPVAHTPTIDCLCTRGLRFDRTWNEPVCSPGRSTLLTGRLDHRTGVGDNVHGRNELPDAEVTLAEVLKGAGYTTGFVGKWHLGGWRSPDGPTDAKSQGFDLFTGTPTNLLSKGNPTPPSGEEEDFYGFWHVDEGGEREWVDGYATSIDVDDALRFVRRAEPPWLLVLSLHAPHPPMHVPPADLVRTPVDDTSSKPERYRAALEAVDTELGRLLDAIDRDTLARTTVVVTADNGTSPEGVEAPEEAARAKSTLYERGIRVPLLVSGAAAARRAGEVTPALAHVADLLPTFAELAGAEVPADLDGVSLVGVLEGEDTSERAALLTRWTPAGATSESAARDERYKLIRRGSAVELYDLVADPGERTDLVLAGLTEPQALALGALTAELSTIERLPPIHP